MMKEVRGQQFSGKSFDEVHIGDKDEIVHTITAAEVDAFAQLSGDYNPLHINEEYAKKTFFGKRVVHGMLSASFISALLGMKLPGPGSLWLSQTLNFLKPVFIGDILTVVAEVKEKVPAKNICIIETIVTNQNGQKVVAGEAKIKILETEK